MESKYYTPELKEFHVGFEYEYFVMNDWHTVGYHPSDMAEAERFMSELHDKKYRVKYLDLKDIESLGFTITEDNEEIELSLQSKRYIGGVSASDDYRIIILYGLENKEMWIYKETNSGWEDNLFKGIIKNKSELINLLEKLNKG